MSKQTPLVRVVAGVLRHPRQKGLVFMAQRSHNRLRPGMWEYPGGRIEPGERTAHALVREWKEELDADIEDSYFIGVVQIPFESGLCSVTLCGVRLLNPSWDKLVHSEHMDSQWVRPTEAIKHLPCTPSTYLFYPAVLDFIADP